MKETKIQLHTEKKKESKEKNGEEVMRNERMKGEIERSIDKAARRNDKTSLTLRVPSFQILKISGSCSQHTHTS
jgi:hypothetical protein